MDFFGTPSELSNWIRDKEGLGDAFNCLLRVVKINSDIDFEDDVLDIKDCCTAIFNEDDEDASEILYKILSRHNLTKGVHMEKKAQSRQRNDWMRGERNKWNRAVDGHKEETPWRIARDQFYDFTHYTTDAISFDADPNHVYSGEALWRMYVMDKFYREHKTEDGKWVGGYINDRFHVFPTAGTPANPDAPRDGGNQLSLGLSERTRKPRPHQYSTERRLEEARGNETYDLEVTTTASSFSKMTKIASKVPVSRRDNVIYNIFTDCVEMKEAGIEYENMIGLISDHYDSPITDVAQIAKFAENMIKKHNQIAYSFDVKRNVKTSQLRETFKTIGDVMGQIMDQTTQSLIPTTVIKGTILVKTSPNLYEVASGDGLGKKVMIESDISDLIESIDGQEEDDFIQDAADEMGLNDEIRDIDDNNDVDEGEVIVETFPIQEM